MSSKKSSQVSPDKKKTSVKVADPKPSSKHSSTKSSSKSDSTKREHKSEHKSDSKREHKSEPKAEPPKVEPKRERVMYPRWDIHLGDSELDTEGLGVFAARDFKKGEIVEICPYLQIFKGHVDDQCELIDYTFDFDNESEVLILGYGSMYNHHKNHNLEYIFDEDTDMFEYSCIRDIKCGEELTVDYGEEFWLAREEEPK